MRKPQRLIGFAEFENISFPFEFDEQHYLLNLYPPDQNTQAKYNSINHLFNKFAKLTEATNEWIPFLEIQGTSSERYQVSFHVSSNYVSYQGFLRFNVAWFFIWEKQFPKDSIRGLHIQGTEIDAFFPPDSIFKYDIKSKDSCHSIERLTLTSEKQGEVTGGSFQISDHLNAKLYFLSYPTFLRSQSPVSSQSRMTILFSRVIDLSTLIQVEECLRRFFIYIAGRTNVSLDTYEIFTLDKDNKRYSYGLLSFPQRFLEDSEQQIKEQIIDFSILGVKTADLLQIILSEQIGYQHLPSSIDDKRHYSVSRFILILAAFEREFRNIYGTDKGRSERFSNVKTEIVRLVKEYQSAQIGKNKEYAMDLLKGIKNFNLGYWFNVEYALKDCRDIMERFTVRKYGTPHKSYEELIAEVSRRVGRLRNNLAHDNLDWSFEAIQISDIKVVEELLYAIRLKQIGLSTDKIQNAIKKLFQEI